MMEFGTRLRALRTARGLTQQELAAAVGISKSSVNMYERGEREPGIGLLQALAACLDVDMNQLLGADAPMPTEREERVLLLARRAAGLPKAQYDRLVQNFEDTLDLYLEAMGLPSEGQ